MECCAPMYICSKNKKGNNNLSYFFYNNKKNIFLKNINVLLFVK